MFIASVVYTANLVGIHAVTTCFLNLEVTSMLEVTLIFDNLDFVHGCYFQIYYFLLVCYISEMKLFFDVWQIIIISYMIV